MAPRTGKSDATTAPRRGVRDSSRSAGRSRDTSPGPEHTGPTTIALANQKGGVAKTTSVASIGAALAEQGQRVLLVDLDPQACLTFSLGVDPDTVERSVHDVLTGTAGLADVVITCDEGLDLVPSAIDLAGAEAMLLPRPGREYVLRSALEGAETAYDVVILDCSPSLGVLTLNALTAADALIIPMPCEMLSHRGVGQLLDTVADVQKILNRDLEVWGILPTLFDGRSNHAREVLADVGERYDLPVLEPPIPKTVRFAEAPAVGRSILTTARTSKGAQAYRDVAASLLARL
ncbi:ParA family protein [Terrabacter terrigena]|uniref:ParA family protein n=1 Tax=Terrabacter terrigena TaxID=574718 RepID=A0ABW3MSF1_9MICO